MPWVLFTGPSWMYGIGRDRHKEFRRARCSTRPTRLTGPGRTTPRRWRTACGASCKRPWSGWGGTSPGEGQRGGRAETASEEQEGTEAERRHSAAWDEPLVEDHHDMAIGAHPR